MKATVTLALFFLLLVGTVGGFALLAVLPWWMAPAVGFGGWKFFSSTVEALHKVHSIPTC
jgi:hypothetical protein